MPTYSISIKLLLCLICFCLPASAQERSVSISPTKIRTNKVRALLNTPTNLAIDATVVRSIGGTSTMDRAAYFNHWGHFNTNTQLDDLITDEGGFNSVTGRETFELDTFIAQGLEEDPNNPGFFRPTELIDAIQTSFRNFILSSNRWSSLREHPNPIFVQSGRADGFWPDFTRPVAGSTLPVADGGTAYAQLLTAYADEVLFGTGPGQGFLPFDPDRHYLEIMNEPQLELNKPVDNAVTWTEVIEMHRTVTETVKANFPQVNIGGASVGDGLVGPHRWSLMREMMDDMEQWSAEFDFWSIHPYECYRANETGAPTKITFHSPAHLNGLLDLFEATSSKKFGEPKQFCVTEYGAWGFSTIEGGGGFNGSSEDFGSYTRDQRQWDVARDTKEKMMEFLRRPDRIINATPFVGIQHFTLSSPSEETGYYNFFDRLSDGSYVETILGQMYRMYNDVNGEFASTDCDNVNTQAIALVDGNQVHVLLNNMQRSENLVNIDLDAGSSAVVSATLSRLFFDGVQGVYEDEVDVTASWQSIAMLPDEGAVLTLTLDSPIEQSATRDVETSYAMQTEEAVPSSGFVGPFDFFNIEIDDLRKATFRISFSRPSASLGESFLFFINGTSINVAATGDIGYDDGDSGLGSREIEVPVDLLQNGQNQVFVQFGTGGGQLLAVTLESEFQIESVIGQHVFYNGSFFDDNDPSPNAEDASAFAGDKSPLFPGETATFANYTSYVHGINGMIIDFAGSASALDEGDFAFRVGNDDSPGTWAAAPAPLSITYAANAGEGSSDRVTLIWDNGVITNQWLEVRVLANGKTGLTEDYVFYFGSVIGECGTSTSNARVDADDVGVVRNNLSGFFSVDVLSLYDINRDSRVDASDIGLVRSNLSGFFPVNLITPTLGPSVRTFSSEFGSERRGSERRTRPVRNIGLQRPKR